jgi:ribosomal subunit interface protein
VEVVLKGRGYRISDHIRDVADHKLAKLSRLEPRSVRIEVEIISEKNPRLDGTKRVEAALEIPKRTFRAHAESHEVETAFDELVSRLERQVRDYHGKKRTEQKHAGNRLKSGQHVAEESDESEGSAE